MNEIEYEGRAYILKANVESIVKERVSKVASRASEAEARASEIQEQLKSFEGKQASVDVLTNQINELKTQLQQSNTRFNRYQSISKIGITDTDLIDVIEWQYDKAMKDTPAKEQTSLSDWLDHHLENPTEAPRSIRPHLTAIQSKSQTLEASQQDPNAEAQMQDQNSTVSQLQQLQQYQQTQRPPNVNQGAVKSPDSKDIISRVMSGDQDFYNKNVDAVRQAWTAKFKR